MVVPPVGARARTRNRNRLGGLCLLIAALLVGLGQPGLLRSGSAVASAEPAQQSITLTYPNWMLGEAGVGDYWRASIEEFQQRNPGVTIRTTLIPSNQYEDKTLTGLAAGQAPDIYPVFTNMMPRLIDEEALEPLDDYLAGTTWKDQQLPAIRVARRGGKTYGVVLTASPQGMIYNKQLLDRAGVTAIPTTPEEFYQAVKQVKERTGEYGYGFPMLAAEELNAYITTMQWILGYGSDWADADGRVTANDPRNVEAMTWIKRFLDEDLAPKGVKIVDLRQMFAEGKLAFMFEGPWVMTLVKTKSPELYPYVNFVAPPTPTKAAITGGAFFAIPREAKNKELAWKYIAMINEEGWQRRWLEDLVQIPGQPIQPSPAFLEANPWVRNMIDIAANYQTGFGYAPPNPRLAVNAAEFRKIAMRYVERIYAGGDVKRELDAAQRDLEAFVAGLR